MVTLGHFAEENIAEFVSSSYQASFFVYQTGTRGETLEEILAYQFETFIFVVDLQEREAFHYLGDEYFLPQHMDRTDWRSQAITRCPDN